MSALLQSPPPRTRSRLLFAQVREDPRIELSLLRALEGDALRVLAIASGGCTALSLVACDRVAAVDAVDANPAQIALCRLKRAVLEWSFDLGEARALLGDAGADPAWRRATFERILPGLPGPIRRYWADRPEDLERGVLWTGWFERLFASLRAMLHEMVAPPEAFEALFDPAAPGAGREFLARADAGWWERAFELFFDERLLLEMFGPTAIQHASGGSYGAYFRRAFERALLERPLADDYFLASVLLGRTLETAGGGPPYLRSPSFERVRARLDRVRFVALDLERFLEARPEAPYDLVQLSNLLDWMDDARTEVLCERLASVLRPGSIVLLRRIHNDRPLPAAFLERLEDLPLEIEDRSSFYERVRAWRFR